MKAFSCALLLILLGFAFSCSKDEAVDIRKAFLGSWEYAYDLSCSPPGGTISDSETLDITKGNGSSKIDITF